MSLAVLADHMASKGRGNDSMLVHMTPREVAGLQALAKAHGGSLTINPDTGLPEAGWVDKLLPAVIGFAVNTFAPGIGTAIGEALGTSAAVGTGIAVGGAEALRTGDISRGLQAGLGAYGGAGLSAGMMNAGTGALTAEAAAIAGTDIAAMGAAQGYSPELIAAMQQQAIDEAALQGGAQFTAGESLSKGFDLAKANPMQAVKDYGKPLMYAAGPAILAAASTEKGLPQTVTKPGMIRPYTYNPYSGGFIGGTPYEAAPTKSANGGLMGLAAGGMAGYGDGDDVPRRTSDGMAQGGMYDFAQRSEPVVRMASGGIAGYAVGGAPKIFTDEELYQQTGDWNKAAALRDAQNVALSHYNATNNPTVGANINQWIVDNPFATAADINAAITKAGLTQDIVNPYLTANTNISDATRYALSHANEMPGSGGLAGMQQNILKGFAAPNLTQAQIDTEQRKYGISDADIQSPLTHGYQIADTDLAKATNYLQSNPDVQAWLSSAEGRDYIRQHPEFDASDIAYTHYMRYGKGEGRTWEEATKKPPITCGPGYRLNAAGTACEPIPIVEQFQCPSGYHYDPVTRSCVLNSSATQETTTDVTTPTSISTAPSTSLPVGVSGAGVTTINPNGTITTRPDLSLGMSTVRDAYTKGGGSLGFIPYSPKSLKELEDKYPITGGSKQSYDYLMGRTPYSATPYTKTGEVMKSYAESVLGMPTASSSKMYIFDPATKTYKVNPDYAIPTFDSKGVKSYNLTNKDVATFMDTKPSTEAFYTWATTNNLSPEQIATASGRPINEISKLFTGGKKDSKTATSAESGDTIEVTDYYGESPQTYTAVKQSDGTYLAGNGKKYDADGKEIMAAGGLAAMARGGMAQQFNLGDYSDGGRLLRGPGDGVSDSIPATIGNKRPARLADGEFVVPARIVSELGNGSTEAGARKLYAMMDRIQKARRGTVGKGRVAKNSRSEKYLPA